jgi:hypothetical protein
MWGHANHATHACVLSQSSEWTRKAAAIALPIVSQLTVCDQFPASVELQNRVE